MNEQYGGEAMDDYSENINWDDVGSNIPVGKYDFVVEEAKYQLSKTKKHMVNVRLKVDGAHDSEQAEATKNKSVFENFVFTAQGGFRVKDFAKASGAELPPTVNKAVLEDWCQSIVGLAVGAEIHHRPDQNNEPRASVKKFFAIEPRETSEEINEQADGDAPVEEEPVNEETSEETVEASADVEEEVTPEPEPEPAPAPAATKAKGIREAVANLKSNPPPAAAKKTETNGVTGPAAHVNGKATAKK